MKKKRFVPNKHLIEILKPYRLRIIGLCVLTVLQAARYDEILKKRVEQAEAAEMKGDFMLTVMQAIHEESVRQQVEILKAE